NEITQSETQWKYSLFDKEDQLITVVDAPLDTPVDNPDLDLNWEVVNSGETVQNDISSSSSTGGVPTAGSRNKTTNSTSTSTVWVDLNGGSMPAATDEAVANALSLPAERAQSTTRDNNINYVDDEGKGFASNPGGVNAVNASLSWVDNTDELTHLAANDPRLNFEDLNLTAQLQSDLAGLLGSTSYQLDGTGQGSHRGYIERDTLHYYTSRQVTLDSGRTITVFTNRIEVEEKLHVFVPLSHGGTENGWREVVITTNTYNYDVTSDFLQADDSAADSVLEDAQNNPLTLMPSLDWAVDNNMLTLDSSDVVSVFGATAKVKVLARNDSGTVVMNNTQYNWSDGMAIALDPSAAAVSLTFVDPDGLVLHAVDLYSSVASHQSGSVGLPGEGVGLEHLPEVNKFWLSAGYQSSRQGSGSSTHFAYNDSVKVKETTYAAVGGQKAISNPGQVDTQKLIVTYENAGTNQISSELAYSEPGFSFYDITYEQLVTINVSGLPPSQGASVVIDGRTVTIPGNGRHRLSSGFQIKRFHHQNWYQGPTDVSIKLFNTEFGEKVIAHGASGGTHSSEPYVRVFGLDSSAKTVEFSADGKTVTSSVANGLADLDTSSMASSSNLAFTMTVKDSSGTVINEAKGNFNNTAPATVNNLTNAVTKSVKTNTYSRNTSSDGDSYTSVFYSQTGLYNR
ncbi:hypothetical protein, partial [Microbulbifer sp. TYP-18]|uniref:hypothetical protein n=1 Tax=Microbulbifer sp. TYP-18 TaxID=3230024 RepID=UPI0034C5EC8E